MQCGKIISKNWF